MIGDLATSSVLRDTLNTVTQLSAIQWQDTLTFLGAVFSLLLVIVAWFTYREHNRPYVTLYAETSDRANVNLVIKNSGNRAAYNVTVKTDIPLESVYFSRNPEFKLPFVTEKTHPFIGPDQLVSGEFDILPWRYNRGDKNYTEPSDKYLVTIKYRHKIRTFTEKYQLDLSYLEFVPWGYSKDHMGDISSSLKKISDRLPGGITHSLYTSLKNAPSKSQRVENGQNGNSSDKTENA